MSLSKPEGAGTLMRPEAIWLDRVSSTNDVVKRLAIEGAPEWTTVVADYQDAGRGRLGRAWHSDGPWGLWTSILLRPRIEPIKAPFLGILAGLAAAEAIISLTGIEARVKWPNDVEVKGLKVCGVLPESGIGPSGLDWVVIGIGMNLNEPPDPMPQEIRSRATTLEAIRGKRTERRDMLSAMLDCMQKLYDDYVSNGPGEALSRAESLSAIAGCMITVIEGSSTYEARAVRMDEAGALIVERPDGTKKRLLSAEVSVRRMG